MVDAPTFIYIEFCIDFSETPYIYYFNFKIFSPELIVINEVHQCKLSDNVKLSFLLQVKLISIWWSQSIKQIFASWLFNRG